MKKIIILLTNLLLISMALFTTVTAEGDATGNAWLDDFGSITVSTDLKTEDLLQYAKGDDGTLPTDVSFQVYVAQPKVSSTEVVWDIGLVLMGTDADGNYLSYQYMTQKLPGTITLELGLPSEFLKGVPAVEEGMTRKWKFIATHEDGTVSEYEAKLDEANGMVTVVADQFSSFKLTYTDTKTETPEDPTPTPAPTPTPTPAPAPTPKPAYVVVDTADRD